MAGLELLGGADVDEHDVAAAQPRDELVAADGVDGLARTLMLGVDVARGRVKLPRGALR